MTPACARRPNTRARLAALVAAGLLCLASVMGQAALVNLGEADLAAVSGEGIALGFDSFQFAMAPTSYFEQVGNTPSNNCTATGNVAANWSCWRRGDLRWYGLNMSGATAGAGPYQWDDVTNCDPSSLDCPRGGTIANFSPFDNPYIIRSWSPQGMAWNGDCINGTDGAGGCNDAVNTAKTLYEFLAPTAQPNYSFSFWGEIEAGSTRNSATQTLATAAGSILKSQTIIRGNAAGSIFRLFQFTQTGNLTFGMFYHSRLQGDFRFSLAQTAAGAGDAIGAATLFAGVEGLHFRNVSAFVPLGQLYYQAITLGPVGAGGNFYIELTPIPNTATVYTEFYGINTALDTTGFGYETARNALAGTATADYLASHGFSRWGDWHPGMASGRNAVNLATDGIFYRSCTGCGTFYAFADRPIRIDKRGPTQSMQQTQNYNCATGNAGGCAATPTTGPIVAGAGDPNKTYPVTGGNAVNLGDSRIDGLLIDRLHFESCAAGGC